MSTAIYLEGALTDEKLLFSFGDGVQIDEMFDAILGAIDAEGLTLVSSFIVTSSEHLDSDLQNMMLDIQEEVFYS